MSQESRKRINEWKLEAEETLSNKYCLNLKWYVLLGNKFHLITVFKDNQSMDLKVTFPWMGNWMAYIAELVLPSDHAFQFLCPVKSCCLLMLSLTMWFALASGPLASMVQAKACWVLVQWSGTLPLGCKVLGYKEAWARKLNYKRDYWKEAKLPGECSHMSDFCHITESRKNTSVSLLSKLRITRNKTLL